MKKVHLIVQNRHINKALDQLKSLSLVHVDHLQAFSGHHLTHLREDVELLKNIVEALKEVKSRAEQDALKDWRFKAEEIKRELDEIEKLSEDQRKGKLIISQWEPWGNFDPIDIERLESRRIFIKLFKAPANKPIELPEEVAFEVIFTAKKKHHCVAVAKKSADIPYEEVALPQKSLTELMEIQEKEMQLINKARKKIKENAKYLESLEQSLIEAQERLNFEEVSSGMKRDEQLSILKGFCPKDRCDHFREKAQENGWGLLIEDPTEEDQVPTLLKNSKWVDLSKPAFNVIEILPGYKEFDVSAVFLIFFTLFFAILIGDAAYGAIFAIMTIIAQIKLGKKIKDKTPFLLMYQLSGFTILWGVLTGTFFGQKWIASTIKPVLPWLNETQNIQLLCFIIALAHLSIARIWAAKGKWPSLLALGEIGWLFIVWGMFFLANMFVLGMDFPKFAIWFFYIGIPLALFFMVPFNKFLKVIPQEILPFALNIVAAGTDIVSYIRLFAVGLATVAVADAANAMPSSSMGPAAGWFFLIFLHTLNIILAAMAILVHAIRLNVLEFSGHLDLQWTGFRYNPFQSLKKA